MITFCLLTFSITSFAIGLLFSLPEISLFSLQIFSVYVLSCFIDSILGSWVLWRSAARKKTIRLHPLTWVGRQFLAYQETINYRLSSLSEMVEQASNQSTINTPQATASDTNQFYNQILLELDSTFTPLICGLLIQIDSEIELHARGVRSVRDIERIKKLFRGWFLDSDTKWLGIIDTLDAEFPTEELAEFGLRYILSSPFISEGKKGILLLGFDSQNEPNNADLESLTKFSKVLEREFTTLKTFQELESKVKEAEKGSQDKSAFITHISHDIRSPLNNIKAILTLLKDDLSNDPDTSQLIEAGLRNCDSATELVSSLVEFAKLRTGKLLAQIEEFNLSDLVFEVVANFEVNAKSKGLQLNFAKSLNPLICKADRLHVSRILNNLIGNAIKYTETGTVTVGIHSSTPDTWIIRVSDTGPGFSEQQQEELFIPFSRIETQRDGYGLGLALSKVLAELNSGNLMLRSVEGAGSVFTLSLPSAEASNSQKINTDKIVSFSSSKSLNAKDSKYAVAQKLSGISLLVVDDDIDSTQSLSRLLTNQGAEVSQANTVLDAMSIINFDPPDVLITDANMPEGGGKKLVKFIKAQFPESAVIVISGDSNCAEEFIALGATCVMDKPLHIAELFDYLEDIHLSAQQQKAVGSA